MSAEVPSVGDVGRRAPWTRALNWYAQGGRRRVVSCWLVSLVLALVLLVAAERYITGDVFYYRRRIRYWGSVGLAHTLNEYPTPVVWILSIPYGLTGGNHGGYLLAFVTLMLALDGGFTLLLWRSGGHDRHFAAGFWTLFVFAIGPLSYLRFDLLPAVLAGTALVVARRRPALTGALTALGAAVKLWPALLVAAFLAHRPGRRLLPPRGRAAAGVGLALLSLLAGGWARLVSPLTWQSDRGLQIESVWATPLMVLRALQPVDYQVLISPYQAYEVYGSGVTALLTLSTLATVLGLLTIAALAVRASRATDPQPVAVGLVVLATIAIMTITNKTLSPQYLLWLGGPAAALLALSGEASGHERRLASRLAVALLALAVLPQLLYPLLYNGYLGREGYAMLAISTIVAAVRNLALVAFTGWVCQLAWRELPRVPVSKKSVPRT